MDPTNTFEPHVGNSFGMVFLPGPINLSLNQIGPVIKTRNIFSTYCRSSRHIGYRGSQSQSNSVKVRAILFKTSPIHVDNVCVINEHMHHNMFCLNTSYLGSNTQKTYIGHFKQIIDAPGVLDRFFNRRCLFGYSQICLKRHAPLLLTID